MSKIRTVDSTVKGTFPVGPEVYLAEYLRGVPANQLKGARNVACALLEAGLATSRRQALYFARLFLAGLCDTAAEHAIALALGFLGGPNLDPVDIESQEFRDRAVAELAEIHAVELLLAEPMGSA
jgi:hypothetical protein